MAGGGYVVGQAIDTVKLIEGARMRLTSALGSATRANQEIKDAFSIAEKRSLIPDQMLEAMSKLSTFFKDDQMRRYILGAINDFATTTGKGNEGLQRSIKAITDIQSKGKLQAEELTGQLGEIGLSSADVKQEIAKIMQLKGEDRSRAQRSRDEAHGQGSGHI
jgi:tape measure domain